jgi:hypothetical protein
MPYRIRVVHAALLREQDLVRMTKTQRQEKKRKKRQSQPDQNQPAVPQPQTEPPRKFTWMPLWGWILLFLLPLIFSEFMFYMAGRVFSMIAFPIAWIGFWFTLMHRSGWAILKKKKEE